MKWFNNLRISTKLISSFVIVSIIGGLMGLYGYMNMNSVDKDYQNLYANYGISLGDLGSAGIDFNAMRVKLTNIVLITDREKMQQLRTEINELDEKIDANLDAFYDSIQSDATRESFASLRDSLEQYRAVRDDVIELALAGRQEEAMALMMKRAASVPMRQTARSRICSN